MSHKQQPDSLDSPGDAGSEGMDFRSLVSAIRQVHAHCTAQARGAVNVCLTLRNWTVGCYIREYEQRGADRAQYGANLLDRLATSLHGALDKCYTARYLRICRRLYEVYPQIRKSVISEFSARTKGKSAISKLPEHSADSDCQIDTSAPVSVSLPADRLVRHLSFTALAELVKIDAPLKRAFYEVECIRGNWSVRALKRQIATLYFERSGLSTDKEKLAAMTQRGAEIEEPKLAIRDPYVFEFLGLRPQDAVAESDLEAALVENLREFLLEMGHGFCLEAQQKSIVIGNTRGFVDLVSWKRNDDYVDVRLRD